MDEKRRESRLNDVGSDILRAASVIFLVILLIKLFILEIEALGHILFK
jgi:hypothetical protein